MNDKLDCSYTAGISLLTHSLSVKFSPWPCNHSSYIVYVHVAAPAGHKCCHYVHFSYEICFIRLAPA